MTNEAKFSITLEGNEGGIGQLFAAFKKQLRSDAAEIEQITGKIELFKGAEQKLKLASDAFFSTRARVDELRISIAKIEGDGNKVPEQLAKSFALAEKAAAGASREYNKQATQVDKLKATLASAGVDTRNLAAAEERLAAAARTAAAAATEQQQKQSLSFKTLKDIQPELDRLRASYTALRDSGKLSFTELAALQSSYQKQVAQVRGTVSGLGGVISDVKNNLVAFTAAAGAIGLSIGVIVAGVKKAVDAAKEFDNSIARIGIVTNATGEQLGALGDGARALARDLGLDVNDVLRQLFELIRSGVPKENAIEVLRVSAEAAKAGITDLASGVKVANALIDGFGISLNELPLAFDKIIKAGHSGGLTLKEFADNAGPLLNVARAAGIGFDDLLATLTVVTDKTGDAGLAVQSLTKIITQLDTAQARDKLRQLGIEGDSLVSIFSQIGAKGLGLNDILQLGIGSAKSAAGIAALTKNAGELPGALQGIQTAAGTTADSLAKLFDTPAERAARFNAAIDGAIERVGRLVGSSSGLVVAATRLINFSTSAIDFLQRAESVALRFGLRVAESGANAIRGLAGLPPVAEAVGKEIAALGKAAADSTDKNDRLAAKIDQLAASAQRASADLGAFGKQLADNVQTINAALQLDVGDLNARAAAQIAALDRSVAASKATAQATLEIETKVAADRLALIVKAEASINDAIDKAAAARAATVKKGSDDEKNLAASTAQARISALAPVLAQYQAHYNALVQQAQSAAQKIREIDNERVEFNRSIEQQLFTIRLEGLSAFDQYIAKTQEADRLIGESQRAAAEGTAEGAERAKKFSNEAIGLANQLGTVTDQNGVKIVTALQAQSDKLGIINRAAKAYNDALDGQKKAATDGAEATKKGIDEVLPKLAALQKRYDELKSTVAAGLDVKVTADEASVKRTLDTLNELTKPREVVITVRQVNADGTLAPPSSTGGGAGEHFAKGGEVGVPSALRSLRSAAPAMRMLAAPRALPPALQYLARGGPVFRRPGWSKVPGVGNQDTVPAALQAGSFVVRKAASLFYGDGVMTRLARGYASGGSVFGMGNRSTGTVPKEEVRKWAISKWGFDPFSSQVFDPGGIGNRTDKGGSAPVSDPKFGHRSGDSFQGDIIGTPFSIDSRPIPEALITAVNVIQYAKEMLNSVGQNNPLLGSLLPAILQGIQAVERNPNDQNALKALLQSAETIGANPYLFAMWGKTAGSPAAAQVQPQWFIDWLADRGLVDPTGAQTGGGGGAPGSLTGTSGLTGQPGSLLAQNPLSRSFRNFGVDVADRLFHPIGNLLLPSAANNFAKQFVQTAVPAAGNPPFVQKGLAEQIEALRKRMARPFAAGGPTDTDTVPAMLTPGEHVIQKPRVRALTRAFGPGIMHAINSMRVHPIALRAMLAPTAPVSRFATGGPVGTAPRWTAQAGSSEPAQRAPVTINLNASAADLYSEANIRRFLIPALDSIERRSGKR